MAPTMSCSLAQVECVQQTLGAKCFNPKKCVFHHKMCQSFPILDSGLVLKAIHLPREHGQSQEVTLEQLQVFQVHQSPILGIF